MIPKTIIIDIDGCIFQHHGKGAGYQWSQAPFILPGVKNSFDLWEKEGCCIVLMTARKESCRSRLEIMLREQKLFWDHLIMGVSHGDRILINDKKSNGDDSCFAINRERNVGL